MSGSPCFGGYANVTAVSPVTRRSIRSPSAVDCQVARGNGNVYGARAPAIDNVYMAVAASCMQICGADLALAIYNVGHAHVAPL